MAKTKTDGGVHHDGPDSSRKNALNPEEAVAAFREEYLRCGALTMADYNRRRAGGAPCAAAAIRRAGARTWRELLARAGLRGWQPAARKGIGAYTLTMHFACQDALAEWDRRMAAEREG